MRSVTSCFDLTLYKKDLARFWPLWVVYTVFWIFLLPIRLLSESAWWSSFDAMEWALQDPIRTVVGDGGGLMVAVGYGLLCAMAVWSYLYNNRSANLMHSLPVRREGHFVTHTLAGVSMFVLPHLIIFVVTLLAELLCGGAHAGALAAAMGVLTLLTLFFFCFATLCAMLTGHLLALPAFYAIFNCIVALMTVLLDWLGTFFLFGYVGGMTQSPVVEWLTPTAAIMMRLDYNYQMKETVTEAGEVVMAADYTAPLQIEGLDALAIYTVVGLVMLAAALLLYRKRHMETAGDVVAVPFLRPVFLYCVGFCGAVAGGCAMFALFGSGGGLGFLLFSLAIWGVIFWYAGMMLLHKSFKVFKKGLWGCGVNLCLVLLLCGVLETDLLGVETRVPDVDDVASVDVSGFSSFPYDDGDYFRGITEESASIEKIIAVHQTIVNDRRLIQEDDALLSGPDGAAERARRQDLREAGLGVQEYFRVTYTLKNGQRLERNYSFLWLEASDLADPTSLESRIEAMINDRSLLAERYGMDELADAELVGAIVEDRGARASVCLRTEGSEGDFDYNVPEYYPYDYDEWLEMGYTEDELMAIAEKYEEYYGYYSLEEILDGNIPDEMWDELMGEPVEYDLTELVLTEEEAAAIKQAVLDDFYAGNLGVRYLFDGSDARQENTYVADLELIFWVTHYSYDRDDGQPSVEPSTEPTGTSISSEGMIITLTPQAEATIAALKAAGAFAGTGVELRTNSGELHTP